MLVSSVKRTSLVISALALLLAGSGICSAQTHEQAWLSGQRAFVNGDFSSALAHFNVAEQRGLDGAAIHYNIAVCHFKLAQYASAAARFRLVADQYPQMRALANYNLGLVARRQGDSAAAQRYFLSAYELSDNDETLRVLSSNMLNDVKPQPDTATGWSGAIGARAGYDSNVALRDELGLPAGMSADSNVLDLFGSLQLPLHGLDGYRVEADLYLAEYFNADDFDQLAADAGVSYIWQHRDWDIQIGAHAGFSTFGGDSFDRKVGLGVEASRKLPGDAVIDLGYRFDNIDDTNTAYAGINGTRHQVSLRYSRSFDVHRLAFHARVEQNDRDDPGVSPKRFRVGADYRFLVDSRWSIEGGISFRKSDYDDLPVRRSEDLLVLQAGASYLLTPSWLAILDLRTSDNDSGDSRFAYDRTQLMLGVIRTF